MQDGCSECGDTATNKDREVGRGNLVQTCFAEQSCNETEGVPLAKEESLEDEADLEGSDIEDLRWVGPFFTMEDVRGHCFEDSCWLVIANEVYDVTSFVWDHPGGPVIMVVCTLFTAGNTLILDVQEGGGRDSTGMFEEAGHSEEALKQLIKYRIGCIKDPEVCVFQSPFVV